MSSESPQISDQHVLELDMGSSHKEEALLEEQPTKPTKPLIELTENNLLSGFMSEFGSAKQTTIDQAAKGSSSNQQESE